MNRDSSKAILVVSFGTSYEDTRRRTLEAIEGSICHAFPQYKLFHAWTSDKIRNKLMDRENIHIPNVPEAMEEMRIQGITHVIIQPTYVTDGAENQSLKECILSYKNMFISIVFGAPLLHSVKDTQILAHVILNEFSYLQSHEALLLMRHKAPCSSNKIYDALNNTFPKMYHHNIFLPNVDASSLESLETTLAETKPSKIILAPFMIVAGFHALKDMAGAQPNSWCSYLKSKGYLVEPVLKGLGEYEGVRNLFIQHIKEAIENT